MTDLAKLVVRLEAQTAKYQSELERANKKLDRFGRRSESTARNIGKTMAAGLAVGSAALARMVSRAIQTGDQLDKLSTRLGISTENLSRFQFAAERTGVAGTTLNTALQRMQRRIDEVAKTGRGEALPALNELGISAKRLSELTPEQQFLALADSFKQVDEQGTRVRLAMKLFDTEGVALLQTMEGGAEAIAALAKESDELGNTIRTKTAKQAAELQDSLTRIQAASNGAAQELLKNLGPQIQHAAKLLGEILPQAARLASASFLQLQASMFAVSGGFQKVVQNFNGFVAGVLEKVPGGKEAFKFVFDENAQSAEQKAEILFQLMERRFKEGLASLNRSIETGAPDLEAIIPDVSGISGSNGTDTEGEKERRRLDKLRAENAQIISLQEEKFRRLNDLALEADGKLRELETLRFERQKKALSDDLSRLQSRGLLTAELQAGFRKAEEDAERVHQANLTKIQKDEQAVRDQLRHAQLRVAGEFFGALGNLAKENSKAQRILLAAEKGAALVSAAIALQRAIANANTVAFPANVAAIAQATATGAGAINALKSINVSGARGTGGSVRRGQSVVVGEFGPEVATFGSAGFVTPNHRLGGGMNVNVQIIEDSRRGGDVEQDGNTLRIFVNQVRAQLRQDMQQGRGFGRDLEASYEGLRRRTA